MAGRFETPAPLLFALLALAAVAVGVGVLAGRAPEFAVVATLGLAFVLVVFTDLTLGLACFAGIVFLEQLSIGGPALSFSKLAGGLLAVSWLASLATRPDARERLLFAVHPAASAVLLLFLVWNALSGVWAEVPAHAASATGRYLLCVVLFLIVFTAVRSLDDAVKVLTGFLAGALVTALYGIANPPSPEAAVQAARIASTVGDPNQLALALVAGLALSVGLFVLPGRRPLLRLFAPTVGAFCLLGIFLTVSRGGLVALGCALVTAVVVAGRWRAIVAFGAVGMVVVSIGYFAYLAPSDAVDRIETVTSGQQRTTNEGRTTIWQVGLRMFEANPVAGVGAGNFQDSSIHYVLEPGAVFRTDQIVNEPAVAHNTYLETLAETGIVGGVALLFLLGFALRCAWRAARISARLGELGVEILSRALIPALVGIFAGNFFISNQLSKQMWLLMGLAPALLAIARNRERADEVDERAAP